MKSRYLFLLVYLLWSCFGASNTERNRDATCTSSQKCGQGPDLTSHFLQCVGLPLKDTGKDHMRRLKEMLEATMDVYSFMKYGMAGEPLLSLQGELALKPRADPFQNEAFVQMWMEVKIKPLLKSITKNFLACLSTKKFSCSTYQTVVRQLSYHYSEMNPARQKWIYTFFMYPFLSEDRVAGCVNPHEGSEEWLMKNFGAFRVMARMKDFSTLNMVFSGLEVLHLLSPTQKAELLLRPEVAGLDNGTLSLVFHSLLTDGTGPLPTGSPGGRNHTTTPGGRNNTTTPGGRNHTMTPGGGHPSMIPGGGHHYDPYEPPSPHSNLKQVVNGFMTAFRPLGRFVHEFVSFTQEREVSKMRSTTLTQFLLNWTLSEVADMYRPPETSIVPHRPKFDITNLEDWYRHVVMPVLRRFLPNNGALLNHNITLAFHHVFQLDNGMDNETSDIEDVCSITLDKRPCALIDVVENVASVMHCAAQSHLEMSEETIMRLIVELTKRLESLIRELSTTNLKDLASDFQQIFGEADSPALTQGHLDDPEFIKLWFQAKLMPLLPYPPKDLLSCLSTNNFSCPVYQTIVEALSNHTRYGYPNYDIYAHFIYPFLLHHNTSDPQCIFSANDSAEWLTENFGVFSTIPSVTDFYKLNPNFSGLEVLHLLSPKQRAEMLLLPLPTPPEKEVVIDEVFDFLLESPRERRLLEVLQNLIYLTYKVNPNCSIYIQIFERLYKAIPILPPDMEPDVWARIDDLIYVAPVECVPKNLTCPVTQYNGNICSRVNSSALHSHLSTSTEVSCSFPLETYACAQLENFTANQLASLLKCNLPEYSRHSQALWKMLLTELSFILDPALEILANMSMVGPSASEVLDVIGEIRVSMLTDEELMDSSVIREWFSGHLSRFLPFASGRFLRCLSNRNLGCHSYQQILQEFVYHFDNMTYNQHFVVLRNFIYHFLSQSHSGPGCVPFSNSSAEWLMKNLGPFSRFFSIQQLLNLNPYFNPLEVLQLLTPQQSAELLVVILPTSLNKDAIINAILDHLTETPDKTGLQEFLIYLSIFHYQGNLSCSSYRALFTRLDLIMSTVSLHTASSITYAKMELSKYIPPGCIIYSGECIVTMTNETDICVGVNSTTLQLHIDSGKINGQVCDFAVEEFACASLSALKAEDLVAILACNHSSNSSVSRPVWKLLLSKASHILDEALDLLSNMTLDPRNPALSMVLDSIREIRLDTFSLNNPAVIQLWFKRRLRPLLPAVSPEFLSCLTTKRLTCSSYQHIVQILSHLQPHMKLARQISVYTHFIKVFLTRDNTTDSSCSSNVNNSREWLQKNLGGFSVLASFQDLQMLYFNFSAMEALPQLTVRQLAEVSSTPGQLNSPNQVIMLTRHIPDKYLSAFFDDFSPAIVGHESMFPSPVRSAMLQVVFDRANLSTHSVGDSVVSMWLQKRLRPLLVNLSPQHVALFFDILVGRKCGIQQQGVGDLNSTISSLSEETQKEIHNHIIQSLKGQTPLHCYGDNNNHSFYTFLENSFLGFQFPNLTTFLSLMPHDRMHQLVNSMPPSDLGDFLRHHNVIDDDAELCVIYNNYIQTPMFLETESLPAVVRRPTLPCVWPMALSSSERSEVDTWFDRRLHSYLEFLTKNLISTSFTHNASCLAFQKFVSVLGEYDYTVADFMRQDVFNTVKAYLTSEMEPRCYNPSDPELNSTAWFVEYIGPFMSFLTLENLELLGSTQVIQVFTVNPLNIALLNNTDLPLNLTDYLTELIYLQDGNFNPLLLPLVMRCVAPGPAFSQLTTEESMIVLHNLTTLCTDLDPQISAALAGNLGDKIDATAISALGNESTGLSTGQIKTIKPKDLFAALSILSSVMGWNGGQAKAIIRSLVSSGVMKINGTSSLLMLGSLVVGIPAKTFSNISGSQLITASKDPSFLGHITTAPEVVQQSFVAKIILVDSNSEVIIQNIPDEMASQIPRALLLGLSNNANIITALNKKRWKRQQVELFFEVLATESATAVLGGPNNLSSSVLQGFTCTGVRTVKKVQINKLIRACRRTGRNKVLLVETQLTCMYNQIKGEPDAINFELYPHDMLLYYDYSLVPQARCRSYFEQLAEADFSVFSAALSYKSTELFANARSCLGVTNTSLTEDNISVLGNMCCILNGSYIETSDPSILEKLGNCQDLTSNQVAAVEAVLQSGKTKHGAPSTWNEQTLKDLGMLPLYLTSTFYDNFDKKTKKRFLKYFLKVLRSNGVRRQKRKSLKAEIKKSRRSTRSIQNECTVGMITQVTISDETFPFDYDDITQFNRCLSASTVRDNLDAITEKVDQEDFLKIILSKLVEAYADTSIIPEDQVQLLGPASRVATMDDINMWIITEIDTLSDLMDLSNGEWDSSLAKAIISKYLSNNGNTLGSTEINAITGTNLCSLDADVLKTISQQSLREASTLNVSVCTTEKKKELFNIARQAFSTRTRSAISADTYRLMQPFLGGADSDYIQNLVNSNINMDLSTFTSLDEDVLLNLNVDQVQSLLGTNLADLKSYENEAVIQNWTSRQSQEELDKLGIGLMGGRVDPTSSTSPMTTGSPTTSNSITTATGSPTTSSSVTTTTGSPTASNSMTTTTGSPTTSNSMTTTTGSPTTSNSMTTTTGSPTTINSLTPTIASSLTTTNTTGNGARLRPDACLSFLALLTLLITSLV